MAKTTEKEEPLYSRAVEDEMREILVIMEVLHSIERDYSYVRFGDAQIDVVDGNGSLLGRLVKIGDCSWEFGVG